MRRLHPLLLLVLTFVFVFARSAFAAPSVADQARAYAAAHNLPIREVPINLPGREGVNRIFVPVTAATHDDFVKAFTESGAIIRQGGDKEHVGFAIAPNDVINYMDIYQHRAGGGAPVLPPSAGGIYVALGLTTEEKLHFKNTALQAQAAGNQAGRNSGCMAWLANGTIGQDVNLAHRLGIKRSSAPSNLIKKMVHAGNESVVIGVAMGELGGAQTQNLRNQLVNFDRAIQTLEGQIANLETQGGGRVQAFKAQTAPYTDAIIQMDATIAARKEKQPAIAAGLGARKAEYEKELAALAAQHEAPYHARVLQLDQQIEAGRANVDRLQLAREQGAKPALEQVAARERELVDLERAAHDTTFYDRKLHDLDQMVAQVEGQIAQTKVQFEARRVAPRALVAQGEQQVGDIVRQALEKPIQARPGDVNAFNQKVTQLEATAHNFDVAIAQHQAAPGYEHQVADWKRGAEAARHEKEELVKTGADEHNPAYVQRLALLDQQIAGVRTNLNTNPIHASVPQWLSQLHDLTTQRQAMVEAGPRSFSPQLDQRLVQIDQQILANRNAITAHGANPAQKGNLANWRAAVEQQETIRAELIKLGGGRYDPQVDQRLQQATTVVYQGRSQLAQIDLQEEPSTTIFQGQIAQRQLEREAIVKQGPDVNPEYTAAVARFDQVIAQNQAQINQYERAPQYAANVAAWRQAIAAQEAQKGAITAIGPRYYDPQHAQKVLVATQAVTNAKTQVDNQVAQLEAPLVAARTQLSAMELLRQDFAHHGATNYSPAYDQKLTALDQAIATAETQIRQYPLPQHANNRAQWAAQIEANKKLKEAVMAQGPATYNPNEAQIAQLRAQLEQQKNLSAPIRLQLAQADAMVNGGDELAKRFAAIADQDLMGPPPGAGAAEAVVRQ